MQALRLQAAVALAAALLAPAASAEVWQWTDAEGVVRYTPNPDRVPQAQRSSLIKLEPGMQAPAPSPSRPPVRYAPAEELPHGADPFAAPEPARTLEVPEAEPAGEPEANPSSEPEAEPSLGAPVPPEAEVSTASAAAGEASAAPPPPGVPGETGETTATSTAAPQASAPSTAPVEAPPPNAPPGQAAATNTAPVEAPPPNAPPGQAAATNTPPVDAPPPNVPPGEAAAASSAPVEAAARRTPPVEAPGPQASPGDGPEPPPAPRPLSDAERARRAQLEEQIAADQEALKELISREATEGDEPLRESPELREIARRLPALQAELRALEGVPERRDERAAPKP